MNFNNRFKNKNYLESKEKDEEIIIFGSQEEEEERARGQETSTPMDINNRVYLDDDDDEEEIIETYKTPLKSKSTNNLPNLIQNNKKSPPPSQIEQTNLSKSLNSTFTSNNISPPKSLSQPANTSSKTNTTTTTTTTTTATSIPSKKSYSQNNNFNTPSSSSTATNIIGGSLSPNKRSKTTNSSFDNNNNNYEEEFERYFITIDEDEDEDEDMNYINNNITKKNKSKRKSQNIDSLADVKIENSRLTIDFSKDEDDDDEDNDDNENNNVNRNNTTTPRNQQQQATNNNHNQYNREDPNTDNDIEWYKFIKERTITNQFFKPPIVADGTDRWLPITSKIPNKWILFIGRYSNCSITVLDDTIREGDTLYLKKSESNNTLEAYSMHGITSKRVGTVKINNSNILPVIRKNYCRLLVSVKTLYPDSRIDRGDGLVDVDCYFSHLTELDDKIDKIEPPPGDKTSSSIYGILGRLLKDFQRKNQIRLTGYDYGNHNSTDDGDRNDDDDDNLYSRNETDNLVKKKCEEIEQPSNLLETKLLPYQLEGIWWMKKREMEPYSTNIQSLSEHWRIYTTTHGIGNKTDGITFYYNSFCDKITLFEPKGRKLIAGGMLCDQMGLGKTLMSLTLSLCNHPKLSKQPVHEKILTEIKPQLARRKKAYYNSLGNGIGGRGSSKIPDTKSTLVILPLAVLNQWKSELEKHLKPEIFKKLVISTYHSSERKKISLETLMKSDFVFTTHRTFANEYQVYEKCRKETTDNRKMTPPKLLCIHWWRVIIDEAHKFQRKTILFRSIQNLDSIHRWCLTGTPYQNNCEDLFPMLYFLNVYPIAKNISTWNRLVESIQDQSLKKKTIKNYLNPILLARKRKDVNLHVNKVTESTIYLDFDNDESDAYRLVFNESKDTFNKIQDRGDLNHHYNLIFKLITRLRRCCDHSALIKPIQSRLDNQFYCCFCFEQIQEESDGILQPSQPVISNCDHLYCKECVDYLFDFQNNPNCNRCTLPLQINQDIQNVKYQLLLKKQKEMHDRINLEIDDEQDKQELIDTDDHDELLTINRKKIKQELNEYQQLKDQNNALMKAVRCQLFSSKIKALFKDIQETMIEEEFDDNDDKSTNSSIYSIDDDDDDDDDDYGDNGDVDSEGYGIGNYDEYDDGVNEEDEMEFERTFNSQSVTPKKKKKRRRKSKNGSKISKSEKKLQKEKEREKEAAIKKISGLKEATGKNQLKAIVFCHWTSMLDYIEEALNKNGWMKDVDYCRYDSSLSTQKREKVVEIFQAKSTNGVGGPRLMLMSLMCGGVGLNLERANIVYLMEPAWAPMTQAIGRVDRIGQKRDVIVKRFIMNKTIEVSIEKLQATKQNNADAFLSDDDTIELEENPTLSIAEIKELFEDYYSRNDNRQTNRNDEDDQQQQPQQEIYEIN